MNLNHLHLRVRDLDRSLAFYARFFGLNEHVRHGAIAFVTDDARFDLALAPADEVEPLPAWFHFGFRLDDADAVRRLHDEMQAAGVAIVEPLGVHQDLVWFRCADPDGYRIEVYWE